MDGAFPVLQVAIHILSTTRPSRLGLPGALPWPAVS
jgi:hypothetical protein